MKTPTKKILSLVLLICAIFVIILIAMVITKHMKDITDQSVTNLSDVQKQELLQKIDEYKKNQYREICIDNVTYLVNVHGISPKFGINSQVMTCGDLGE